MAPVAAARRAGARLPELQEHLARINDLASTHRHVLVEGAGGLLVALDDAGHTIADLARRTPHAEVIVVCRSTLGTLNHTELTLQALAHRTVPVTGVVIGSWPAAPDEVDVSNRAFLAAGPAPLLGAIPAGAGTIPSPAFRARAPKWLATLGQSG
jgi:dethiobiotin synthetase